MNVDIRHYGKIEKGKIIYYNPQLFDQQMFQLEGKEITLLIKERHKRPSRESFGFYFGGILPTCHKSEMFMSFDKSDDIHYDYFAPKFLSYTKVIKLPHEQYTKREVRDLSSLSQPEMSEFIERVLSCCATELGIEILPAENYYSKYNNR